MEIAKSFKITISFERRPDGGLRAWSDDVPGLVLSHSDPEKVVADIPGALETILSEMLGGKVEIAELLKLSDACTPPAPKRKVGGHHVPRNLKLVARAA